MAYFGIGGLYLRKGHLHEAVPVLERGVARCQVANIPVLSPRVASLLGYAYALSGRVADALPVLEQAVQQATSMKLMFGHSLWVAWLGEAYLLADRRGDALECAQRALDLSRDRKERGHEAWTRWLLGEIAAQAERPHLEQAEVGQTTHLAARMEQLAGPGTVLLTADTLRLAEGYVEVKPLGPVPVKGLEAPVEVYEMLGAGPRRSRFHAAAARGLTRFVGRDVELEQLRQALGRAAAGHGQVVAIVGEPGVGKSRLVWEVTHSHRTHGWLILESSSASYGRATPYLPVIDLFKAP